MFIFMYDNFEKRLVEYDAVKTVRFSDFVCIPRTCQLLAGFGDILENDVANDTMVLPLDLDLSEVSFGDGFRCSMICSCPRLSISVRLIRRNRRQHPRSWPSHERWVAPDFYFS